MYQGRGEGTQESRQIFFFFAEKKNWTTYWFSFFLNTVVPLNLAIENFSTLSFSKE